MRWIVLCALAQAACDAAFGLAKVSSSPDASAEAGIDAIAAVDADDCKTGHDEDGDRIPDRCDNCPTVPNQDQANHLEIDNGNSPDNVGDACDPNPTLGGDTIALFTAFTTLDAFTILSGVPTTNGEDANLTGASELVSKLSIKRPTRIALALQFTPTTPTDVVQVVADGGHMTCEVQNSGCTALNACMRAAYDGIGSAVSWDANAAQLDRMWIESLPQPMCHATALGASTGFAPEVQPLADGTVGVRLLGTGRATLRSFIVYAEL